MVLVAPNPVCGPVAASRRLGWVTSLAALSAAVASSGVSGVGSVVLGLGGLQCLGPGLKRGRF